MLFLADDIILATRMDEKEIKLEIAVMLYEKGKLTIGKASELAEIGQIEFQHFLASRNIRIHYDTEELEKDLKTLDTSSAI